MRLPRPHVGNGDGFLWHDGKRALRKRLARGTQPDFSDPLFAYRRLDPTL